MRLGTWPSLTSVGSGRGNRPTLDLNLLSELDPRITFTRASSGTHFDSTGRLVTDGNNVARFDYDPAVPAGAVGGELVTNGDFAAWSGDNPVGWSVSPSETGAYFVTQSGNAARFVTDGTNFGLTQNLLALGKTYTATIVISACTGAGSIQGNGGVLLQTFSSPGSYTVTWKATSIEVGFKRAGGSCDFTVTSFSVQELTFSPRGLLIEEQRANLLLHSRDMTQAAWSKTDVTAARTQVGIDGVASSACLMTEGSAGTAIAQQDGASVTAGSTITVSAVLKRGNTDWVRVGCFGGGFVDGTNGWFNLNTGAKGAFGAVGAATAASSTITSLGGGWYRCSVTCLPNGAYTVPKGYVISASADSSPTRVANATYIVDCAQLEVGAFATSPIITGAATATRAADVASMTGTNFSSWFNASAGTFVVEVGGALGTGARVFTAAIGSLTAEQISIASDVTRVRSGAVDIGSFYTFTSVAGKRAIAYASAQQAAAKDGASLSSTNAGLPTGLNTLHIGTNSAGAGYLNGHLRSLRFYSSRLPNAELQSLTAAQPIVTVSNV